MSNQDITKDLDIRVALHAKRLNQLKTHPETIVIDELGLAHAKSRIDVAVINGCIHGYEIKSAADNLDRLASQIEIYRQTLQKLTLVTATKHLAGVLHSVPEWCGIIEAEQGSRNAIHFNVIRPARTNPDVDPIMMAHLLWRDEVIDLLAQNGFSAKDLRKPRLMLYQMLSETLTAREITTSIRTYMTKRPAWRDHPRHA